uniref:Dopamine receptor 3-like n=1 Tax=Saccoglossus kowalevskii TaxID=10224 RepID=A0ABM0M4B2_SACKO|nr:PREDICTED: dopamine receptor 3-like [Saccoglossus kowalevskii]
MTFIYDITCMVCVNVVIGVVVVLYCFVGRVVLKRNARIGARAVANGSATISHQGGNWNHTGEIPTCTNSEAAQRRDNTENDRTPRSTLSPNNKSTFNYNRPTQLSQPVSGVAVNTPASASVTSGSIRMLVTVTVVFLFTWIPFTIVVVLRSVGIISDSNHIGVIITNFLYVVPYINNGCNPIVYAFVSKKFRNDSQQVLQKMCRNQ